MSPHELHTLSFPTDTAIPITSVPIFYLHDEEHPFCATPGCLCHASEARLKALLQGVLDRNLQLRKTYNGGLVGKGIQ